jgi:hypothetical protein
MGQFLARLATFLPAHRLCGSKESCCGFRRYSVADGNNGGRTAGGRAASDLSLAIVEVYGVRGAGRIFANLSANLLTADNPASSSSATSLRCCRRRQARLAMAVQVTRIRETFLHSAKEVPQTLLERPAEETLIKVPALSLSSSQGRRRLVVVLGGKSIRCSVCSSSYNDVTG